MCQQALIFPALLILSLIQSLAPILTSAPPPDPLAVLRKMKLSVGCTERPTTDTLQSILSSPCKIQTTLTNFSCSSLVIHKFVWPTVYGPFNIWLCGKNDGLDILMVLGSILELYNRELQLPLLLAD